MPENEKKKEKCRLQQFERNNYFYGKLMTVRDFELEQEYFNGKRYLLNRLIHGKGLLCGFSNLEFFTSNEDELRVKFRDGGVALDFLGREIIVPVDAERSVLDEGGSPIKTGQIKDTSYLYLRYTLHVSEIVHAASNPLSSEECACPNRLLEDFEVVAFSEYPKEKEEGLESVFCLKYLKTDEKIFFAALDKNLQENEDETGRRHYIQVRERETVKKNTATGTVSFIRPTVNSISSGWIDPKLGTGPIGVSLGLENEDGFLFTGTVGTEEIAEDSPSVHLGSILDPASGKFKIRAVFENEGKRTSVKVRWWAFRPNLRYGTEKVRPETALTKYKFASDPQVKVKLVENGLCESGAKNCMQVGDTLGGDHYARVGNYIALNGNPKKLVELCKEQDNEPHYLYENWDVGGGWVLNVVKFDNTLKIPRALLKLYFDKKEVKEFSVSEGDLITYCEDLENEKNVPLFVSYIADISVPIIKSMIGKEASVILKYTWAISKNVGVVK